ncbi:MAG: lytic transglycosylase domain-containing protein [Deltaproteobacteria bacterium]|nr:lytic transglycosylase domain-containing protein [Deltaproteobacteria bacterium]
MIRPIQNQGAPRTEKGQETKNCQPITNPFTKTLGKVKDHKVKEEVYSSVIESSAKYNLPPELILAVIKQESGFKQGATSHCGAAGMMQLMPETAKELGVTNRYDIGQNIDGGCKYLREMLDRFDGNLDKALAAYNAGPGNVEKHGGIPPFEETQNYVASIKAHIHELGGMSDNRTATFAVIDSIDLQLLPDLSRPHSRSSEAGPDSLSFSQLRRRV